MAMAIGAQPAPPSPASPSAKGDDVIPLGQPCPKCERGELVVDDGVVQCDACGFRAI